MAKGVVLRVEKRIKKPVITRIRRKKKEKSMFKKVVDYLKSDSYMFAPLVSHSPFRFLPSNVAVSSSYSTPGVENKKNKSLLVEEVGEYLNSDSYLYAPLFAPSSKGVNGEHLKRVVSEKKQETNARVLEKAASEEEEEDGHVLLPERRRRISSSSVDKLVEYKKEIKTVKQHMFYKCCRSSSLSGKRRLDPQLRKYLIE